MTVFVLNYGCMWARWGIELGELGVDALASRGEQDQFIMTTSRQIFEWSENLEMSGQSASNPVISTQFAASQLVPVLINQHRPQRVPRGAVAPVAVQSGAPADYKPVSQA